MWGCYPPLVVVPLRVPLSRRGAECCCCCFCSYCSLNLSPRHRRIVTSEQPYLSMTSYQRLCPYQIEDQDHLGPSPYWALHPFLCPYHPYPFHRVPSVQGLVEDHHHPCLYVACLVPIDLPSFVILVHPSYRVHPFPEGGGMVRQIHRRLGRTFSVQDCYCCYGPLSCFFPSFFQCWRKERERERKGK